MNPTTPSNDASPTNTTDLNTHNNISTPNRSNVVSQSQGYFAAYIHDVRNDAIKCLEVEQLHSQPKELAVHLALGYIAWCNLKRETTTDEVFRMVLNFLHMTSYYREFRYALRVGDTVMIEWLYKEFPPLFRFTSKKHYFRIVCDMMEK